MRIAHVSDCYLPRLGGIEVQVHDLAARQLAAGHDVEVITSTALTTGAVGSHEGGDDVRAHRVGRGVARAVGGRYDVVHVHLSMFSPFGLDVLRELAARRVPAAATMHSLWGNWELALAATRPLVRWRSRPVVWSAVSEAAASPLRRRLGLPVAVVPNGVDVDWWAAARRAQPADGLRVLSVMRLCRRKRPFPLVTLLDGVGGASLTLVGAGPDEARLRRHVAGAGLPVSMTGALSRPAIRDLMGAHDVYVAPAPLESFGLAAAEARSAGLPVVAHAGSGLADVIRDGVDGLLVDSDAAMAAALVALRHDKGLLHRLRRGASSPPELGWSSTLAGYDRLYAGARAVTDRSSRREPVAV